MKRHLLPTSLLSCMLALAAPLPGLCCLPLTAFAPGTWSSPCPFWEAARCHIDASPVSANSFHFLPAFAFGGMLNPQYYVRLSNEHPTNYYEIQGNQLQFIFYKEYGGDNEALEYYFLDEQRNVYIPPAVTVNKGINYITVDISNHTAYPRYKMYLLFTKDAKGRKQFMRFYKP